MVIRVINVKVRPGKQALFKRIIEQLAVLHTHAHKGMVAFYPCQPEGANTNEFALVTIWTSLVALKNVSVEDWVKSILPEELAPLIEETRSQLFEAFGAPERRLKPLFNIL